MGGFTWYYFMQGCLNAIIVDSTFKFGRRLDKFLTFPKSLQLYIVMYDCNDDEILEWKCIWLFLMSTILDLT